MDDLVKVTVRLPRAVHAAVRTRAFREGVTLDALGREWFEAYASDGLAAGERDVPEPGVRPPTGVHVGSNPTVPAPAASPSFRPDPKGGKR